MSDEQDDFEDDPFNEEFGAALMAAAELVVYAKRIGLPELEFPLPDDGNIWVVNIRKLGIKNGDEHGESPRGPGRHDGTID